MGETGKLGATARVRLVLDIPTGQSWGRDCTASQIHAQAVEHALGVIRNKLPHQGVTVVGDPKVIMVFTEDE